jgi:hypothetical protein
MTKRTASRGLAAALACVLAPVAWAAPASPTSATDKSSSAAETTRKALNAPITVKIERQSLTAAVEVLKEQSKVNITVDTFNIQQTGFSPDAPPSPVDVDLKNVKLKSALHTILQPFGLSYVALGDSVLITTEPMALIRQMRQHVSVDLDKVEFAQAVKQLGREAGVSLVIDSRVEKEAKTEVSLELEDVPLETAVRLLSEMAGLKPVRVGNVLFVTSKERAAEMRKDPDLTQPAQPAVPVEKLEAINAALGNGAVVMPAPAPVAPAGGYTAPALPPPAVTAPPAVEDKPRSEAVPERRDDK